MKLFLINILTGVLLIGSGSALAERARVEVLAFIMPSTDAGSSMHEQPDTQMLDSLRVRIGYDFNREDGELDSKRLRELLISMGGDLIGHPTMTGDWGMEIETGFLSQMLCRVSGLDGSITERLSNPDESPGMHLIITPAKLVDDSTQFSLDYDLELALISGSSTEGSSKQAAECPALVRYQFNDQIISEADRWTIIGLLILENPDRQSLYEVWVMTRLRVE